MLRIALYGLLLGVAAAAAVLSFSTLRDLALVCGFSPATAWLLPLVLDAGAAAGTLAWLSRTGRARAFGRALAMTLLGLSVVGNALGHGLAAAAERPAWIVVVAVSAVAPAVLGAVVHLAMLCGRRDGTGKPQEPAEPSGSSIDETPAPSRLPESEPTEVPDLASVGNDRAAELVAAGAGRRRIARELGITEHEARQLLERERVPA